MSEKTAKLKPVINVLPHRDLLLFEVTTINKKIFDQIPTKGIPINEWKPDYSC